MASLKANIGSQNYEIPPEVDPVSEGGSVIIYCRPFQVIFSVAPLQPAGKSEPLREKRREKRLVAPQRVYNSRKYPNPKERLVAAYSLCSS